MVSDSRVVGAEERARSATETPTDIPPETLLDLYSRMLLVRAFEEAAGAKVRFVHTPELARAAGLPDHPGFDVLSMRPSNDRRCIEVKGRASTGEIEVTDNEWARACNLRADYWLYAVYHCGTPMPQMVRVQDPFEKLLVRPFTKTQVVETVREVGGVRIAHAQVMEAAEI